MVDFIITPTEDWLRSELENCQSRLLISSPYVGNWLPRIHQTLKTQARKVLLTRADLRDFASGASDLDALCALASQGTEIICSHKLHAKVYVVDEICSLVTSANATYNGMRGNLECGVVVRDLESVRQAAHLVLSAFGAREAPQRWTISQLESLREPVRQIKETLSPKLISPVVADRSLPNLDPAKPLGRALREHLPGWTRLALEGVQVQPPIFNLDSFVAACSPLVASRYPNNHNVRPKLRQQLQRLRDLGLIEFLGKGVYQRSV